MAKFLIIGGGLAGLSSAVFLSEKGHSIELIEASPKLGGRAYSFKYRNDEIDNGQHILLGAYKDTLKFLEIIGTSDLIDIQNKLEITFVSNNGSIFKLKENNLFYPFNLLSAILNYNRLNFTEKFNVIKYITQLPFYSDKNLQNKTILQWLREKKQSENAINSLWKILSVGGLNTPVKQGSALLFKDTLKKIFLQGSSNYKIIIPKVGLSKLFVEQSLKYLISRNNKITLSERAKKFSFTDNKISEVITNKRVIKDFDHIISAVPLHSLLHIQSSEKIVDKEIIKSETSSITSIYIWLHDNFLKEKFYALIESPIHWVFNHGSYLSLVISASDEIVKLSSSEIKQICINELKKYFAEFNEKDIIHLKVIKEKKATNKTSPEFEDKRRDFSSLISNVKFTGDWTNTGLPLTIESAVSSGKKLAESFQN